MQFWNQSQKNKQTIISQKVASIQIATGSDNNTIFFLEQIKSNCQGVLHKTK